MKKNLISLLIIIFIFSFIKISLSKNQVENKPILTIKNFNYFPNPVANGESFDLNLNIVNIGSKDAKNIKIEIKKIEGQNTLLYFSPKEFSNVIYINLIQKEESKNVKFSFNVDENIKGGVYNFVVEFNYEDDEKLNYYSQEIVGIFVNKKQEKIKPNVLIENIMTEPKIVEIGKNFKLYISLFNIGEETAKGLKLQFNGVGNSQDLYPFTILDSSNTIFIGDLKEGERKKININFSVSSDAKEGLYNLNINIIYENSEKFSELQKFGIIVKKIEPQKSLNLILSNYKISPEIVNPGNIFEIDYTITNISKETAYNITHKIERLENTNSLYPFSPVFSTNINKNNLINSGASIRNKIKFFVSPDAESKTYNLLLSIKYEDINGNFYETTSTIGVIVLRKPIISIFNFSCPEKVKENETFTISCEIGNTGNYPIRGVILFLKGLPVNNGDKFIGTLESGNYDTYEFDVKLDKEGNYSGELIIQYVDDSNNIHETKKEFKILVEKEVVNESKNNNPRLTIWQKIWRFILKLFGIIK
ncbi:MAG: hypothetical protein N3D74_06195 [Caldisericia bacterium]|nr:hypothetical protein [Caldisericia bacterium]